MVDEIKKDGSGSEPKAMPLMLALQGQEVRLAEIQGGKEFQHRLAEMGLTPGVKFKIINQGHPGPVIILLKNTRLVLGRGMIHRVFVTPCDQ